MHNQAGTSANSSRIFSSRDVRTRPSRDSRASGQNYRGSFFFSFFFHHPDPSNANPTCLPLVRRLRRRRQLKIVSRRRAVTKRTENDGQPDWQRLCTRHYPLQVLRAAAYICMSARIPQPRDAWRLVRKRKKRERRKKKRLREEKLFLKNRWIRNEMISEGAFSFSEVKRETRLQIE